MIIIIETVILCIAFFLICFWGTGTDNKNLKSYSSYPDEVQNRIKSIAEYQGKFKECYTYLNHTSAAYKLPPAKGTYHLCTRLRRVCRNNPPWRSL